MSQHNTHTLLISPDQEWPSKLYGHLVRNGLAPLTIVSGVVGALDVLNRVASHLVLVDLVGLDLRTEENVIQICHRIMHAQPVARIVLLTEHSAPPPILTGLEGAYICISRDTPLAAWPGRMLYLLSGEIAVKGGEAGLPAMEDSRIEISS